MLSSRTVSLVFLTVLVIVPSTAQHGHKNPPTVFTDETHLPAATYAKPDPKLMLQQANDLKELSDAIPGDIEKVSKGMISKDLTERLKKIEKLAKKLREEVQL
ncbi:MAG TPA: hypothetical protein VL240_06845 [Candidatus Binatia bacterium]|nr:hypothetical protein [Candidatus Binatia bacterium]